MTSLLRVLIAALAFTLVSAELIGVGLAKAEAIIAYREQYGSFATPEELLKVKGIGTRVLAANTDNILVED